jgi:hypothetical protein
VTETSESPAGTSGTTLGEVYWDAYAVADSAYGGRVPFGQLGGKHCAAIETGAQAVASEATYAFAKNEILANAGPEWDKPLIPERLAVEYVRYLEARASAAGPPARVTAVLDVNGAVGIVSLPGDSWATAVIGDISVRLRGKETARFKAPRWIGVLTGDGEADAGLLALLDGDAAETADTVEGLRELAWDMLAALPASPFTVGFAVRAGQLGVCDPDGQALVPACADPDDDGMDDDLSADPFTVAREDGDRGKCEPAP